MSLLCVCVVGSGVAVDVGVGVCVGAKLIVALCDCDDGGVSVGAAGCCVVDCVEVGSGDDVSTGADAEATYAFMYAWPIALGL